MLALPAVAAGERELLRAEADPGPVPASGLERDQHISILFGQIDLQLYIGTVPRSFIRNNTGSQRSRSYRQVPNSTPNPKLPYSY